VIQGKSLVTGKATHIIGTRTHTYNTYRIALVLVLWMKWMCLGAATARTRLDSLSNGGRGGGDGLRGEVVLTVRLGLELSNQKYSPLDETMPSTPRWSTLRHRMS
jgi:hypothetical protein